MPVKPAYASVIAYNIACCHQQTNGLRKCDKNLEEAVKWLKMDLEAIRLHRKWFEGRMEDRRIRNAKIK